MNFNIKPFSDRVLVKFSEKEAKSAGGILIPATAQDEPMTGEVVAVGPTASCEVGDLVMFGNHTGTKISEGYMMFDEPVLLAVLEPKDK